MRTPAILSVLGTDRIGIVAAISQALADARVNIEDIRQGVVGGVFSMTMYLSVDEDHAPLSNLRSTLDTVAKNLGLQITLQREEDFRYTHRV